MKTIQIYSRGKNPRSSKKRLHTINDMFFDEPNLLNSYYAGFIAADGNIRQCKKHFSIGLSSIDRSILVDFLNYTDSNYLVHDRVDKDGFSNSWISINSPNMCAALESNFSIIPAKSLVLIPPKIVEFDLIDSFIVGYIDGDGSINLLKTKRQEKLQMQILGTMDMLTWIQNRFSEILGYKISCVYKQKNHWVLVVSDRRARIIFEHLYNVKVPKMSRKWSSKAILHCRSYKKFRNEDKYRQILNMSRTMSKGEIADSLGVSVQAVYWYMKQDIYKQLYRKGEMDLETSQADEDGDN